MQPSEPTFAAYIQLSNTGLLRATLGIEPISIVYMQPSGTISTPATYMQLSGITHTVAHVQLLGIEYILAPYATAIVNAIPADYI